MISSSLLERARALLQQITPWPWDVGRDFPDVVFNRSQVDNLAESVIVRCESRDTRANAKFIAAAPDLVSQLASALEAAEQKIQRLELNFASFQKYEATKAELQAQVEREQAIRRTLLERIGQLPSPWSEELWECDPQADTATIRCYCRWCKADVMHEMPYAAWAGLSGYATQHPDNGCLWLDRLAAASTQEGQ